MFDFGNANDEQRKAISASDGAVLITAGPGTGKTYTLVQRAIYLIQECGVKPEQILMATFTEKAAKELITRITNELAARNIYVNVNEMYIGTFHSLCLRIIKDNLEFTALKKNYRLLDTFDQKYLVFRNIQKFRNIADIELVMPNGNGAWRWADAICNYANTLSEELVDVEAIYSVIDNQSVYTKPIYYYLRNCINPIDEFFNGIFYFTFNGIFYFTDGMKENIVDNGIFKPFPKFFNTIQFRTVRGQKNEFQPFEVFVQKWLNQFCMMNLCIIKYHYNFSFRILFEYVF